MRNLLRLNCKLQRRPPMFVGVSARDRNCDLTFARQCSGREMSLNRPLSSRFKTIREFTCRILRCWQQNGVTARHFTGASTLRQHSVMSSGLWPDQLLIVKQVTSGSMHFTVSNICHNRTRGFVSHVLRTFCWHTAWGPDYTVGQWQRNSSDSALHLYALWSIT